MYSYDLQISINNELIKYNGDLWIYYMQCIVNFTMLFFIKTINLVVFTTLFLY